MAKIKESLCKDNPPLLNDCIICDTAARMREEGITAWSVDLHRQPLCGDCNYERMMEMMD